MRARPVVPRSPMSDEEREMARHLGRCRFAPATSAKRFAFAIAARAEHDDPEISDREAAYLRSLVYTFRRQIPSDVVTLAGDVPAQRRDFRALQEWRARHAADRAAVRELIGEAIARGESAQTVAAELRESAVQLVLEIAV